MPSSSSSTSSSNSSVDRCTECTCRHFTNSDVTTSNSNVTSSSNNDDIVETELSSSSKNLKHHRIVHRSNSNVILVSKQSAAPLKPLQQPTTNFESTSTIASSSSTSSSSNVSSNFREKSKTKFTVHVLTTIGSIIYAMILIVLAIIFYALDLIRGTQQSTSGSQSATSGGGVNTTHYNLHLCFNITLCIVGLCWLSWLHYDIQRYKKKVVNASEFFRRRSRTTGRYGSTTLSTATLGTDHTDHHSPRDHVTDFVTELDVDKLSTTNTEVIFNQHHHYLRTVTSGAMASKRASKPEATSDSEEEDGTEECSPTSWYTSNKSYRFIVGRHSTSFYLKCGMAAFCFGHVIHEGLKSGHQVYYYASGDHTCQNLHQLFLHTIRPIFSFYQLFMLFKYSNIVISRWTCLASFGLMHLIGTSIAFWVGSIVDDAIDFYVLHHLTIVSSFDGSAYNDTILGGTVGPSPPDTNTTSNMATSPSSASVNDFLLTDSRSVSDMVCQASLSPTIISSKILPYMYPFSIEYNLCLAVMWYLIWSNVGSECGEQGSSGVDGNGTPRKSSLESITKDDAEHFSDDGDDIDRRWSNWTNNRSGHHHGATSSNIIIRADCHASNKGLFVGIFVLLINLVMMFMFFITFSSIPRVAFYVFTIQEVLLTALLLLTTIGSYWKTSSLDLDMSSIAHGPNIDTILLMVPLPCFFISYLLSIISDVMSSASSGSGLWWRPILLSLMLVQIILQTIFITDATNRCSKSRRHRRDKPGREMIMMSILLNLTSWIVYTFETKAAESFFSEPTFLGETTWMIVSHTTLPLMLFFRFHSSVCLGDVWKFAYERPQHENGHSDHSMTSGIRKASGVRTVKITPTSTGNDH